MSSYGLLIGIDYKNNKKLKLNSCIDDVNNMGNILKHVYHFDNVDILTDEHNPANVNGSNIIMKIYEIALLTNKQNIKNIWIHFCGHGCYIHDTDDDDHYHKDECIVPIDYEQNGIITDDLIKNICKYFNKNTNVIFVFDWCHSGTIGDLEYKYFFAKNNKLYLQQISTSYSTNENNVIILSGCKDNQISIESYKMFSNKNHFSGALTSSIIKMLSINKNVCIFQLLKQILYIMKAKGLKQIPQLSSNFIINKNHKLINL
jgi:hypothetical protein